MNLDVIGLRHGTDKASDGHDYLRLYERIMPAVRPVKLLEIGWFDGASMKTWRSYLHEESTIVGVDINDMDEIPGVVRWQVDATSMEMLDLMQSQFPPGFDYIIDDGSHLSPDVIATLTRLWPYVAPGGYYIVEDLHVSYHPDWQGFDHPTKPGPHGETSMQFLKRLADDVHFGHAGAGPAGRHFADVASIAFHPGVAIIQKAKA